MEITETLYVYTREDWRKWLQKHHQTAGEIWLISYLKETGKPSLPYNDAVEEALCFGWIDSTRKKLDDERYVQRYTPRRPRSDFSQTNKERLKRLIDQGKVTPEILTLLDDIDLEKFEIPEDIMTALRANEQAWENFQKYSGAYQRIRIAYIDSARKRPEVFEKRLQNFLKKTEEDKQFGYGIESYY
jgi:uncharacterized protein YdeI (YjbR/CyaY-like superfamily)